jgi:hypothetical protein
MHNMLHFWITGWNASHPGGEIALHVQNLTSIMKEQTIWP